MGIDSFGNIAIVFKRPRLSHTEERSDEASIPQQPLGYWSILGIGIGGREVFDSFAAH